MDGIPATFEKLLNSSLFWYMLKKYDILCFIFMSVVLVGNFEGPSDC